MSTARPNSILKGVRFLSICHRPHHRQSFPTLRSACCSLAIPRRLKARISPTATTGLPASALPGLPAALARPASAEASGSSTMFCRERTIFNTTARHRFSDLPFYFSIHYLQILQPRCLILRSLFLRQALPIHFRPNLPQRILIWVQQASSLFLAAASFSLTSTYSPH